jgi:PEP-CTERM motif
LGTVVVGSSTAVVPEPETYAMMVTGLGLLGFMLRRQVACVSRSVTDALA